MASRLLAFRFAAAIIFITEKDKRHETFGHGLPRLNPP
jgi:hypothetical protein